MNRSSIFFRDFRMKNSLKIIVVLILTVQSISYNAQNRVDLYYFSSTCDTILFPLYNYNDSTSLLLIKKSNNCIKRIMSLKVKGYDNYTVPDSILKKYKLSIRGFVIKNDNSKTEVYVKEKIKSNQLVGYSNDGIENLYKAKIQYTVFFKKKKILRKFYQTEFYDGLNKRNLKTDKFYIPTIIKADNQDVYFVIMVVKKHLQMEDSNPNYFEVLNNFIIIIKNGKPVYELGW